ncbi:hypothetical protein [Amycolatopsis nalaikhensis]|uniref:Uncharacterized protein n=1 Tax=Amycolatopsis nalaikhensis TaxID=715472 RepID=A0ABY8Y1L4_9PSEU|nr:hypothetical protein [Amycolatopsis sp. 2-2]WIV61541.1 hypothetical protein QP939_24520 [Amycolatopsis sp. 2-2]
MGVPGWWQRVAAVSEHLAAVEPPQRNEHGFGPDAQFYLRLGELARAFAAEVGDAERGRVLAVFDDLLGDETEPHRRAIALTFLWPLARQPRLAGLGDRVRRELDLIAGYRPARAAESGPDLARLARAELERCGLPATVVPRGTSPAPTGVVLSVSTEEPAGVFLEWNPLDSYSDRYQALAEDRPGSGNLRDYVDDVRDLAARAALDVLAAAGFRTEVRYDFLYGRSRVCRVLGPPELPFD